MKLPEATLLLMPMLLVMSMLMLMLMLLPKVPQFLQTWSSNYSKMVPTWFQNRSQHGSKIGPGGIFEPSWIHLGASWAAGAFLEASWKAPGSLLEASGDQKK